MGNDCNADQASLTRRRINELEGLIARWQGATDPDSLWILRLLRDALNTLRRAPVLTDD